MRTRPLALLLAAALAGPALAGCGAHDGYVRVDDVALGRVVIYRNGIAYYQRRAKLAGNRLAVEVPRDKVDDFLKSLTVTDAATGKPLPVSFPRDGHSLPDGSPSVQMAIQLPKGAPTDVVLTYISEAPSWKPSYRVRVLPDGKVALEGWAIIDNTSGEDWKNVLVGVGSSSALSFRYDLWNVRMVERETLAPEERFAAAPPRGGSPYREAPGTDVVVSSLDDGELSRDADVTTTGQEQVVDMAPGVAAESMGGGGGGDRAAYARRVPQAQPPPDPRRQQGRKKVKDMAVALRSSNSTVVVEGYSAPGEENAPQRALDRANVLRNELIDEGVAPDNVKVAVGSSQGQGPGVRVVADQNAAPAAGDKEHAGANVETDGQPVGESHFEASAPMTIERGSSAMLSVVQKVTAGEVVYLYDPEAERGNQRFAFKAVRFRNPTPSTLEPGPVTVYGQSGFTGEGLTDGIPPNAVGVVPFALDRQLVIERDGGTQDEIEQITTVERGIARAAVRHLRNTRLKVTNRSTAPAKLLIRHTVQKGWSIAAAPERRERMGDSHLFEVDIAAGATEVVAIDEETPIERTIDLQSPAGIEMVQIYLSTPRADHDLQERLGALLAVHREIVDHQTAIDNLEDRLGDYRVRMDELHVQIVTLKAVKSGGQLMRHLNAKLTEISQRVQDTTIELVDRREKLMLARIRFQDGIAELTLGDDHQETAAAVPAKGAGG